MIKYKNILLDDSEIKMAPQNLEVSVLMLYSPDSGMIKVDNIFQFFSVKLAQITAKIKKVTPEFPDGLQRIVEYKKM